VPSFILIRPITVWPQCTNVTDREDRQTDNGLIAYGEPFYKQSPKKAHNVVTQHDIVKGIGQAKLLSSVT